MQIRIIAITIAFTSINVIIIIIINSSQSALTENANCKKTFRDS